MKFVSNTSFLVLLSCAVAPSVHAQDQAPAASASQQPSRAQQLMGATAPKLAELTDDVLYGDMWGRPQLSKRDRSLITVAAPIVLNRPDQLRSHLMLARRNGLSEEELIEAITHMAFYSGWPSGLCGVRGEGGFPHEMTQPERKERRPSRPAP